MSLETVGLWFKKVNFLGVLSIQIYLFHDISYIKLHFFCFAGCTERRLAACASLSYLT
jgi:uncharacterized membrane protein (DUF2068 family)